MLSESQLFGTRARQERRRRKSAAGPGRDPARPAEPDRRRAGRARGIRRRPLRRAADHGRRRPARRVPGARIPRRRPPLCAGALRCTWSAATPARAPESAPLHKLGTDQWAKARRRAAEKVRDVAAELLDLYAQRKARKGLAAAAARARVSRFADAFPFEETADQAEAIEQGARRPRLRRSRWTASSAATSASARPKSRCAPPSSRCRPASRSRCWCRPPCWRSSTTRISATASPTGRCASSRCRASAPARNPRRSSTDLERGTHRHRHRHPPAAACQRALQGSRPGHRRRGASLRRARQGEAQGAARRSARADADRDADPAHAEHGAGRPARAVADHHAAGRARWRSRPSSASGTTRRCARRCCANCAAAARSISCTTRSRTSRRSPAELAHAGARGADPHRPRPDARARARAADGGFLPPPLRHPAVHDHHRKRHRRPHAPTPSSSTAPTASASRSCTSCAAASAARTTAPMPT